MSWQSMSWKLDKVAGPFQGALGGVAWDGHAVVFAAVTEGRILRLDPETREVTELRRYTHRVNGIAFGPSEEFYGGQEGGRRIVKFEPDGTVSAVTSKIDGHLHNHPSDLAVDRAGRIWFADPYHREQAFGPQIFPPLDHASVLRAERDERRAWVLRRMTFDTACPRAVLLSADEKTLYVAEGEPQSARRELRAYPVIVDQNGGDELGPPIVLHSFGSDHRGPHRGIEGMCLDKDGNIVAVGGWRKSGPGPLVYVFSPTGAVIESHALPPDMPMRCAFGGGALDELYVTTGGGELWRATGIARGFGR